MQRPLINVHDHARAAQAALSPAAWAYFSGGAADELKAPQLQLYIRGDKKVPYEQVAWAMTAAQRAGLSRIGFVTESRQP